MMNPSYHAAPPLPVRNWPSLSPRALLALVALMALPLAIGAPTDDVYKLGPDSLVQPGVPQGTVGEWAQLPSEAYPGTLHDYCVYVSA